MYGEPHGVVTWKTDWEAMRSKAGMEVRVPRKLERLIARGALLVLAVAVGSASDRRRSDGAVDALIVGYFSSIIEIGRAHV